MKIQKQGFTLVELIVVITILAILGTIAIMAFSGYSKNARDSARLSDIGNIKKSLELWMLQSGTYPEPTTKTNITYSGGIVWYQGTFGDTVHQTLQKLDKKPVDPLYGNEYTYSVITSKKEFEIGAVLEGNTALNEIFPQAYAAIEGEAYVDGTYNGILTAVGINPTYLLALPSIILSDISDAELTSISTKYLVYNKKRNLPASYKNTGLSMTGSNFNFKPVDVWSGATINNLNDQTEFQELVTNLQTAYKADLSFVDFPDFKGIINNDILSTEAMIEVKTIILTELKQELTNVEVNPVITIASCESLGDILTASSKFGNCDSNDIIVCAGTATGYVISACNVGTDISGTGSSSYGSYFQWGNNGILLTGTSSTVLVDASGYGPGNYYSGSIFITNGAGTYDWTNPQNDNLWGNVTGTNSARQGPCENGYHVPKYTEWVAVDAAGGWTNGVGISNTLKLPFAGNRVNYNGGIESQGTYGEYWTSSTYSTNAYYLFFNSSGVFPEYNYHGYRTYGFPIRCLKN